MYKAVINDNYLCHYNQNHSKKNGQFTSGDGDGDGITNDHANQKKKSGKVIAGWETDRSKLKKTRQKIISEQKAKHKKLTKGQKALIGVTAVATVATAGLTAYKVVQSVRDIKLGIRLHKQAQAQSEAFVEAMKQREYRAAASNAKFAGGDW